MFGGALHWAWPFAAVARHHADGVLERLRAGIAVSEAFASALGRSDRFAVERVEGGTSRMRLTVRGVPPADYRARLAARGVVLPEPDEGAFWLTVNETWSRTPGAELAAAFRGALA